MFRTKITTSRCYAPSRGYNFPPVLLWAGSRSFTIYLVHPFAYFGTRKLFFRLHPGATFDDAWLAPFIAIGLGLTFVLADINFRLLETPFRRRGLRKAAAIATHIRSFSH